MLPRAAPVVTTRPTPQGTRYPGLSVFDLNVTQFRFEGLPT